MASVCLSTQVFVFFVASILLLSESSLVKVPEKRGAAGVFMLIEGERYTLNFSAASAACLSLNVTMATRAQMERALQQGLETCKFGWIHGGIAVVPRLKSDQNCGKGRTGLVAWWAKEDTKFAVYCFSASDLEETPHTSTARPQTSMFSSRRTAPAQTSAPTTALLKSTPPPPRDETTNAATAAFSPLLGATRAAGTVPAPEASSTHIPASLHIISSRPASAAAGVRPQSVNSAERSSAALPSGLVVGGVVLLLLTAAAAWLHKRRVLGWFQQAQSDGADTEMWKHMHVKMDVSQSEEEEEEEEALDQKFSTEVQLCVNPHVQAASSE